MLYKLGDTWETTLLNGRRYRFIFQGEYQGGEYPVGGIHISTWDNRINKGQGGWIYIDNSPDLECVNGFLRLARQLPPI